MTKRKAKENKPLPWYLDEEYLERCPHMRAAAELAKAGGDEKAVDDAQRAASREAEAKDSETDIRDGQE